MRKLALTVIFSIAGALLLHAQDWVDHTLSQMKLKEKIGQLFVYKIEPVDNKGNRKELKHVIKNYKIGGIIFDDGTLEGQANLTNFIQEESEIPVMVTFDGEWGPAMRLKNTPNFPRNSALGCIEDNKLVESYGKEVARELKELGVHVNFAPVADVNTNPANPVIHTRSFGENPRKVTDKVIAYAKGLEAGGILSVSKHFPGHGDTSADSHYAAPLVLHDRQRLDSVELYPFQEVVKAGLGGIMVGHLRVWELEPDRQLVSSLSTNIINGLLKKEMGFKGLVFTDALEMKGVSEVKDLEVKALKAGNDMLLIESKKIDDIYKSIHNAIKNGELTEEEIDEKCRKVLTYKYKMGLNETPRPIELAGLDERINTPEAQRLASQLRIAAITVLGNFGHVFPLQKVEGGIAILNIGKENANQEFVNGIRQYSPVECYRIDQETTQEGRDEIAKKLANFRRVIISITEKDTDVLAYAPFLNGLNLPSSAVVYALFTSYRAMSSIVGGLRNASSVVLAHSAEGDLQKYTADLMFAKATAQGKLPVSVGYLYKEGDGTEITRDMETGITPEDYGIKSAILEREIDSIVNIGLLVRAFPSCQVLVMKNGVTIYDKGYGTHSYQDLTPVRPTDMYDLASLTETTGTLLAVMKLYDEGRLRLTDNVSQFLPFMRANDKRNITVRDLLFHESGMHPNFRFYLEAIDDRSVHGPFIQSFIDEWHHTPASKYTFACSDFVFHKGLVSTMPTATHTLQVTDKMWMNKSFHNTVMQRIARSEVDDKRYVYSNANFILLQQIVESITQMPLDAYLDITFYNPMGLARTKFLPTRYYSKDEIMPTSDFDFIRRQSLHGFVQDETAAFLGGVAGSAGLFSTAAEVGQIYQMLLNGGQFNGKQYLSEATCRLFTTEKSALSRQGLGFNTPAMAPQGFGQMGYTGTCVWADPTYGFVFVFLSNRGNPNAWNDEIIENRIRENIHKVIYKAVR